MIQKIRDKNAVLSDEFWINYLRSVKHSQTAEFKPWNCPKSDHKVVDIKQTKVSLKPLMESLTVYGVCFCFVFNSVFRLLEKPPNTFDMHNNTL